MDFKENCNRAVKFIRQSDENIQKLIEDHPKFNRTRETLEQERERYLIGHEYKEAKPYNLFQQDKRPNTSRCQSLTGIAEGNLLNQAFLSAQNIKLVQEQIRYEIYVRSKGKFKIGNQSETDLTIIMRSIYLQYGKNQIGNTKEQIQELNRLVVLEAVPRIMSQIQQHVGYLERASTMYHPIENPVNLSSAGRKQLPSVTSVFF